MDVRLENTVYIIFLTEFQGTWKAIIIMIRRYLIYYISEVFKLLYRYSVRIQTIPSTTKYDLLPQNFNMTYFHSNSKGH